jgi:hypothetical protein
VIDRHYSLNLKPWSARTLYVYAHADLAQKYSVGLQEIFVSRLCFQEENSFFPALGIYFVIFLCLMPDDLTRRRESAATQWVNRAIYPCILLTLQVSLYPNVVYFVILLCLMPDDFGRSYFADLRMTFRQKIFRNKKFFSLFRNKGLELVFGIGPKKNLPVVLVPDRPYFFLLTLLFFQRD